MSRMEDSHSEEQTGAKNEEGLNNSPQGKKPKKPKKVKDIGAVWLKVLGNCSY